MCIYTIAVLYTHLSCISVNALSYSGPSTEKFDHFSLFFFHTYRNTAGMLSYIFFSLAAFLCRLIIMLSYDPLTSFLLLILIN